MDADGRQTRMRRAGRLGRRGFAVAAVAAVVLVLLGAVAYAAVRPTQDVAARQLLASGRVRISNSRGGDAILGMRDMQPGDKVVGMVIIGNASGTRARLYLGLSRLTESPGMGGGKLSSRLVLSVKRIFSNTHRHTLYLGPLRRMPLVKLGRFRPGEKRLYRFRVRFVPGDPLGDDRYQRASTSLQFTWYARRAR